MDIGVTSKKRILWIRGRDEGGRNEENYAFADFIGRTNAFHSENFPQRFP